MTQPQHGALRQAGGRTALLLQADHDFHWRAHRVGQRDGAAVRRDQAKRLRHLLAIRQAPEFEIVTCGDGDMLQRLELDRIVRPGGGQPEGRATRWRREYRGGQRHIRDRGLRRGAAHHHNDGEGGGEAEAQRRRRAPEVDPAQQAGTGRHRSTCPIAGGGGRQRRDAAACGNARPQPARCRHRHGAEPIRARPLPEHPAHIQRRGDCDRRPEGRSCLKAPLEAGERSADPGFDGAERRAGLFGNVAVAQPVRESLHEKQAPVRLQLLQAAAQRRTVVARFELGEGVGRFVLLLRRFVTGTLAHAPPGDVERAIAHDAGEPGGRSAACGVEAHGLIPDLDKGIMRCIRGERWVTRNAHRQAMEAGGLAVIQCPKRTAVPVAQRSSRASGSGTQAGRAHRGRVRPSARKILRVSVRP
ncbi:hypothetical protein Dimus_023630 [Dionaea muscipula]